MIEKRLESEYLMKMLLKSMSDRKNEGVNITGLITDCMSDNHDVMSIYKQSNNKKKSAIKKRKRRLTHISNDTFYID